MRGYTLIELMAVVVLLAIVVGVATLNMGAVSGQAAIRYAADQLGSCYRLAANEAAYDGRPHLLALTPHDCAIRRPAYRGENWVWETGATFNLGEKAGIERVVGMPDRDAEAAIWLVPVRARDFGFALRVRLRLASGEAILARVAGPTGAVELDNDAGS